MVLCGVLYPYSVNFCMLSRYSVISVELGIG